MKTGTALAAAILASATAGFLGSQALRRECPDTPSVGASDTRLVHAAEIENVSDTLRSWMEAGVGEPLPLEVGERILELLPTASSRDVERIAALLKEPRHARDPGFQLVTRIVSEHLHLHHPESELRKQIPGGYWDQLLRQWAARDIEAAFRAATTLQPEHMRAEFLRAVFAGASQHQLRQNREPEKVYTLLESIADDDLRHYVSAWAVRGFIADMPERFAEIAQKYPAQWREIYSQAFLTMARDDPARAVIELANIPASRRKVAIEALLEGWVKGGDIAGAAQWALENGQPLGRGALSLWAHSDPLAAMNHALTNYSGRERIKIIGNYPILPALDSAPEETLAWIDANLNATEKARVLSQALGDDRGDPPEWQIEAAARVANDPNGSIGRVNGFVSEWQDKEARREWVMSLPEVPQRKLIHGVLSDWFLSAPTKAAAYVETIPNPIARAAVLNEMFEITVFDHVKGNAAARTWANSHLDAETRALVPELNADQKGGGQ